MRPSPAPPAPTLEDGLRRAFFGWGAPEVPADLDGVQAATQATRAVLASLPEEERRRLLLAWIPFGPPPPPSTTAPLAATSRPVPEHLDLFSLIHDLCWTHGSQELGVAAFFVGSEPVTRVQQRLRLEPERLGVDVLARALPWGVRPRLQLAREALRWTALYSLSWPVERTHRITSGFGLRIHPLLGSEQNHRGIDISMPTGTEVRAPAGGVVTRVREDKVNGRWLELDHGGGVRTYYCHLSQVDVKRGRKVQAGEVLALSGDTGRVTGPHLHYQMKRSGVYLDPLSLRAAAERVAEPLPLVTVPQLASEPSGVN